MNNQGNVGQALADAMNDFDDVKISSKRYITKSLIEFTDTIRDKDGKTGGGSAAALCGACAAALGVMVSNLTIGKPAYSEYEDVVKECKTTCETVRSFLLYEVDDDINAFNLISDVLKMDRSNPEFEIKYQSALKYACSVPLDVMYKCADCIDALNKLSTAGCKGAISDIGIALILLKAVMESSRLTCLANIKYIKDDFYNLTTTREMDLLFERAFPLVETGVKTVEDRLTK